MKKRTPSEQIPALYPKAQTLTLAFGALGVIYGDIGTSPLYAIRECFHGLHAIELTEENIVGVLSLVFWSLTVVVSIKYVTFILKADNHGEGGIFALLSLVPKAERRISPRVRSAVVLAGIFGAALLYGDAMITPSISVLSAIEGLNVATEAARPMVGFKEIMKLQPRPKPGHKHQQGNPDRSRGNLHRVGPENLNNLFVY